MNSRRVDGLLWIMKSNFNIRLHYFLYYHTEKSENILNISRKNQKHLPIIMILDKLDKY